MRPEPASTHPVGPAGQRDCHEAGRSGALAVGRWADLLALATLLATAVWFLRRFVLPPGTAWSNAMDYDIYAFDIHNLFYFADRVLHHGGRGLLWNPLLNSGQPFLGLGTTFSLFPPTPLVLLLGPDYTYRALMLYATIVGAVGAFYLGRTLGLSPIAALCGGLAFAFSNACVDLVSSGPNVIHPFAWLPAALCCVEGILVTPTWRRSGALAVIVAFTLVGHPEFPLFLCQIVFLRVVWEMLIRRSLLKRALGALAVGFAVAPLLAAVHVLPVLETMGASVHAASLTDQELEPVRIGWKSIRFNFAVRSEMFNPFMLVPLMLASASAWGHRRRIALFYLLAGLVFLDLGLGSDGYLFRYYVALPLGRLFHHPHRFLYLTALCLSVLSAIGAEAILTAGGRRAPVRGWLILLGMAAVPALFAAFSGTGLWPYERWVAAMVLLATVTVFWQPATRPVAGAALAAALILELVVLHRLPTRRLLSNSQVLFAQSQVFGIVRDRMTSQERIYFVPQHTNFSLERKTPALFGVPSLDDYNPVVSRRYAEFFTMLRTGHPLHSLHDVIFPLEGYIPPAFARRLLDVAAARYVVTPAAIDNTSAIGDPPLLSVADNGTVRVYENPSALPRARWVPQVAVVPDDEQMLRQLAGQTVDGPLDDGGAVAPGTSRRMALIERAPPSGFLGAPGEASAASVTFVRDDPEDVVIAVDAPQRGFLVLADQYAPGWRATVNGVDSPIVRADYAFRLVEVPAGRSTVAFRYRPVSVFAGAAVSALALVGVAILVTAGRQGGSADAQPSGWDVAARGSARKLA
jgi:hypothetical protein